MEAAAILAALRQRGIAIEARPGGKVRCTPAPPEELKTEIRANKPALLALIETPTPCYSCSSRRRWRVPGGPWTCPRCHPPHPELAPLEWIGTEDAPGWTVATLRACVRCGRGTVLTDPQGQPMHPRCRSGE